MTHVLAGYMHLYVDKNTPCSIREIQDSFRHHFNWVKANNLHEALGDLSDAKVVKSFREENNPQASLKYAANLDLFPNAPKCFETSPKVVTASSKPTPKSCDSTANDGALGN
jgi:hypothetical protein